MRWERWCGLRYHKLKQFLVSLMSDSHPDFTRAMFDGYRRARTEAHYNAPYFLQMLQERQGYETAIYLIHSQQPSSGFTHLWERKRLDLTAEALFEQCVIQ